MNYKEELLNYRPFNEQEFKDKELMLKYIELFDDHILNRECEFAHFSASSMILNEDHTKVLMVWHNLFNSWSWTGGHADGEMDMLQTAMREAQEETGVDRLRLLKEGLYAIDILPVWGHFKHGQYVSTHLHLNFTYLFEASEASPLRIKTDENSAVQWFYLTELKDKVREAEMLPVYQKILREFIL